MLLFGVHKGHRGRRIDAWLVRCREVRDAVITALDGGGLALYPASHAAARVLIARQAEVRWHGPIEEIMTLYRAHIEAVDDWIPFDYSSVQAIGEGTFSCRGPDFLMRAYAKALRAIGKRPRIVLGRDRSKAIRPKVLHFGDSYVVANRFTAERLPVVGE